MFLAQGHKQAKTSLGQGIINHATLNTKTGSSFSPQASGAEMEPNTFFAPSSSLNPKRISQDLGPKCKHIH
jgi:hypothetical protein